jgi:hypothetical protein
MKNLTMKKLTKGELQALVQRFKAIGKQGVEQTDPVFTALLEEQVQVDMPLGELLNPKIEGLVMVWQMAGIPFVTGEITDKHQFNAQGLEGLVSITVRLAMALLTATMVELNRIEVFVPPAWKGGTYCGQAAFPGEKEEVEEVDR